MDRGSNIVLVIAIIVLAFGCLYGGMRIERAKLRRPFCYCRPNDMNHSCLRSCYESQARSR